MASKPSARSGDPAGVTTSREGQFLASLSHELRTPLNGVLGMAGLLADTPLDADQSAYLAAIRQSGEHLLGLVNDVLDLARRNNRHLAFGFGIHQCAGLSLARLEGRIAIGRFLQRFPDYRLTQSPTRGGRARFRGFLHAPFQTAP